MHVYRLQRVNLSGTALICIACMHDVFTDYVQCMSGHECNVMPKPWTLININIFFSLHCI